MEKCSYQQDYYLFKRGIVEEVKKLHDNLPPLTTYYVSIRNKEKELSDKLDKEEVVVVAGFGGMGKVLWLQSMEKIVRKKSGE